MAMFCSGWESGYKERQTGIRKEGIGMSRRTKQWLKAAGVRAIRTMAQTAIATIGTAALMGDVPWVMVGSASVLAGALSLLTSVATGLPEVKFPE